LGQVDDLAEVWVNGKLAGTAWKPPYKVNITGAVQPGSNHIVIKSVNLWVNHLVGDGQPGVTTKVTFAAADGKVAPSTPPTQRPRGATLPYRPNAPLRLFGLIDPAMIVAEQ
jgi:hypothetical protein